MGFRGARITTVLREQVHRPLTVKSNIGHVEQTRDAVGRRLALDGDFQDPLHACRRSRDSAGHRRSKLHFYVLFKTLSCHRWQRLSPLLAELIAV
jgi:hypothetical protein